MLRYGYPKQVHLVGFPVGAFMQHLLIGDVFEIVCQSFPVKPCKGVEPLHHDHYFGKDYINAVSLPYMNFFMFKDLLVGFPIVFFGINKNTTHEGIRGFVSPEFNNADFSIEDIGQAVLLVKKYA